MNKKEKPVLLIKLKNLLKDINYIITIILGLFCLSSYQRVFIDDEYITYKDFRTMIIFFTAFSLCLLLTIWARKRKSKEYESRIMFYVYALNLYENLEIKSRFMDTYDDDFIYTYFDYLKERDFAFYERIYLSPEYDSEYYIDKFVHFSENHRYNKLRDGVFSQQDKKSYNQAAYLAMLDALLLRYYYRNNNAPIDEVDRELFNVLLEKLGFGEHNPQYAETYSLDDYRHYADTFCLKQTRKEFADELNKHYRNL